MFHSIHLFLYLCVSYFNISSWFLEINFLFRIVSSFFFELCFGFLEFSFDLKNMQFIIIIIILFIHFFTF